MIELKGHFVNLENLGMFVLIRIKVQRIFHISMYINYPMAPIPSIISFSKNSFIVDA